MILSNNELDKVTGGFEFFRTLRESIGSCFGGFNPTGSSNNYGCLVWIDRRNGHIEVKVIEPDQNTSKK